MQLSEVLQMIEIWNHTENYKNATFLVVIIKPTVQKIVKDLLSTGRRLTGW